MIVDSEPFPSSVALCYPQAGHFQEALTPLGLAPRRSHLKQVPLLLLLVFFFFLISSFWFFSFVWYDKA